MKKSKGDWISGMAESSACRFRTVSFSFSHLCFPQYWDFIFRQVLSFPSSCNLTAYQISNQVRNKTQLSEQLWQKSYSSLSGFIWMMCSFLNPGLRLALSRSHKENRRMVSKGDEMGKLMPIWANLSHIEKKSDIGGTKPSCFIMKSSLVNRVIRG